MKKTYCIPLCCLLLTLLFTSCHRERNARNFALLTRLDSIAETDPKIAEDSLKTLDIHRLSSYNRGYYQLVDIIVKDKNYYPFTSDSLITDAVRLLGRKKSELPFPYARSLMYSGIVRYRMGITDSTAYNPLKDALKILKELTPRNLLNECFCCYYLGEIHNNNGNIDISTKYYQCSLEAAQELQNTNYIFYSCRALFWSNMKLGNYKEAKQYLDCLNKLNGLTEKQASELKNDNSLYYFEIKDYKKSLEIDLELFRHDRKENDTSCIIAGAYSLSDDYRKLNKLDSALHYALLVTSLLKDTTASSNYLYYKNVAELAEKAGKTQESMLAYKRALLLYDKAIQKKLDTQILTLEKKYDLAEAENQTLKFKNRTIILEVISLMLIVILISLFIIWQQRKSQNRAKRLVEEQEKMKTERSLLEKSLILPIYNQISSRNLSMKQFLEDLIKENDIANNPKITKKIRSEYNAFTEALNTSESNFITEQQFRFFTGLTFEQTSLLNNKEKMLLVFIAIQLENQEIAVLLNTTADSVRSYRSRLKKKMEDNHILFSQINT